MTRQQPPVLAPLSARALASALRTTILGRDDVTRLADIVASRYHAEHVVLCGAGTQALQLAMCTLAREVGADTRVALPAFGCYDLATAALGARLPVALYDLDPATLSPDLSSLEKAMEAGARVVVITPLFGIPVDWGSIEELASSYGAALIEDAAQGYGGSLKGKRLGSLGGTSIISFGRGKGWTGGTGGALLRRGAGAASDEEAGSIRPAGIGAGSLIKSAVQWALARPSIYALPSALPFLGLGDTVFHEPSPIAALPAAAAALLVATADHAEAAAEGRRSRAASYAATLRSHRGMIGVLHGAEPGYLRFPLRVTDAAIAVARLRRYGVAQTYPRTLADLPALHRLLDSRDRETKWVGASLLVQQLVTLPTHSLITDADALSIAERVHSMQPD